MSLIVLHDIKLSSEHSQDRQKRFQMWVWSTSPAAACPSGGWGLGCSGRGFHLSRSFFYYADCCDVPCGTPLSPSCPHSHIAAGIFLSINVWDWWICMGLWNHSILIMKMKWDKAHFSMHCLFFFLNLIDQNWFFLLNNVMLRAEIKLFRGLMIKE